MFGGDVKMLCIENHKVFIKLKGVNDFRNYSSEVKHLHQGMHLLIAKTAAEIIECYLEIMVKILINGVANISDDLLILYHSYKISCIQSQKFRNVFLNYIILAIKKFFWIIAHV